MRPHPETKWRCWKENHRTKCNVVQCHDYQTSELSGKWIPKKVFLNVDPFPVMVDIWGRFIITMCGQYIMLRPSISYCCQFVVRCLAGLSRDSLWVIPYTVWPHWRGSCGKCWGPVLNRGGSQRVQHFPCKFLTKLLLWHVHVHFDCAGLHRIWDLSSSTSSSSSSSSSSTSTSSSSSHHHPHHHHHHHHRHRDRHRHHHHHHHHHHHRNYSAVSFSPRTVWGLLPG